jgi:FKBP-type peptidyl-prolyl cis-trans isomerase FkpA
MIHFLPPHNTKPPVRQRTIFKWVAALGVVLGCLVWGWFRAPHDPPPQPEPRPLPPFITTASGLKYRILRYSTGPRPTPNDTVTLHYNGWLASGAEFGDTFRQGRPETHKLEEVIEGWKEGLSLVGVGGIIELEVPPDLGYGNRRVSMAIPSNATLFFRIELLGIN